MSLQSIHNTGALKDKMRFVSNYSKKKNNLNHIITINIERGREGKRVLSVGMIISKTTEKDCLKLLKGIPS